MTSEGPVRGILSVLGEVVSRRIAPYRKGGTLRGEGRAAPRSLPGIQPAVLAIHGYGGTPREMEVVLDAAATLGLRAMAPLLPGHGTTPTDLDDVCYQDWLEAARHHLMELAAEGSPAGRGEGQVIVVGLSLGSVLATLLAAAVPDQVCALGLLGTAHFLASPFPAWPLSVLCHTRRLPRFYVPKTRCDIDDPAEQREHLGYDVESVFSAVEVFRAAQAARKVLPEIHCPVVLIHGLHDRLCPPKYLKRLVSLLGTEDVRQVMMPRSAHVVTRDHDRDLVQAELVAFFERQVTRSSTATR
jgi:carboxylesterase